MNSRKNNYYQQVLKVTQEFLGPAAERFINRQIEFHLDKPPEVITKADVLTLRDSVQVALGLLINDQKVVNQAVKRFNSIVNK